LVTVVRISWDQQSSNRSPEWPVEWNELGQTPLRYLVVGIGIENKYKFSCYRLYFAVLARRTFFYFMNQNTNFFCKIICM
jgi:hypothetical protein